MNANPFTAGHLYLLEKAAMEVVEIPRKNVNGDLISATVIRKLYEEKDWKGLEAYIPDSTLTYLKSHNVVMRKSNNLYENKNVPAKFLVSLRDILSRYREIIFYSIGIDGQGLYHLFNEDEREKVIFCDK